ncbi:hypothetical protein [Cupriavidus sp. CuC1]|uniref:hypothetical protein n=1 Tax=Cupriavidus sp. CuC1 TaxID=3373131 RepID=UPI0037D8902A
MKPNSYALARLMASAILVLSLAACAHTKFHTQACLSGVEASEGTTSGSGAKGATFAGTANTLVEPCRLKNNSQGGFWIASIDRTGPAGLGHEVSVRGGKWLWEQADGTLYSGSVTGGWVMWPADLHQSIGGCGYGVAQFSITLSVLRGHPGSGTFEGCLDDTHLDPKQQPFVFPPQIWGRLSISSP